MKLFLVSFLLIALSLTVFSQDNQIQVLLKMKQIQEKKTEYHRRTNAEYDGYRVKIHFGSDRTKAKEIQTKFNSKYTNIASYEEYQQPNFVVNVGDFKTKLEAYALLKKIKEDFPYAFIVKSKISSTKF